MSKTLGDIELLTAVKKHGPITASKLADILARDYVGLRRRLIKLERIRAIKSESGPRNHRVYYVSKYSQASKIPESESDVNPLTAKPVTHEELWQAANVIQSKPDPWQPRIFDIRDVIPLAIAEVMLNGTLTTEKLKETLQDYINTANDMAHQAERILNTNIRTYPDKDYQDLAKSLIDRFAGD